jgi:hypothetical protein
VRRQSSSREAQSPKTGATGSSPRPRGDYESVPIGPAGRKIAEAWDPAKDEAAGEQCKAYGAAGIMRTPTRLHIT